MAKTKKTPKSGSKTKKRTTRIAQDATAKPPEGEGIKDSKAKKKMGRPTLYSEKLADLFCWRISEGKSELKVCAADDMPSRETIRRWERDNEDFRGKYARAREERGWTLAEEAVEIADTPIVGVIKTDKMGKEGPYTEVRHADMIEHRRLQVETRKWFSAKLNPRRLSDKVVQELQGPGGGPIQMQTEIIEPDYDMIAQMAQKHADRIANRSR